MNGHTIETFVKVYLLWTGTGWEVANTNLDGDPLEQDDAGPSVTCRHSEAHDGPACHRAAEQAADATAADVPTADELLIMLRDSLAPEPPDEFWQRSKYAGADRGSWHLEVGPEGSQEFTCGFSFGQTASPDLRARERHTGLPRPLFPEDPVRLCSNCVKINAKVPNA